MRFPDRLMLGLLCCGVFSAAVTARAQSFPLLELSWRAAEGCPAKAEVERQVLALLGGPTESASRVKASVRAWRGEDTRWHVDIHTETQGVQGERKVDGETCKAVAEASALILAMAVDPEAVAATAMRTEEPVPTRDPSDRPPPLRVVPVLPAYSPPLPAALPVDIPTPETPVGASIAPLAGLDLGSLPGVAPWFGASLALVQGRGRFEGRMVFVPERSATVPSQDGPGGSFALTAFGLAGCHEVAGNSPRLSLCGGLEGGVMRAEGFGVTDPGDADPLWLSVTPSLLVQWRLASYVSLRSEIAAGIPLRRPSFYLEPYGEVHRASPVVGRVSVGPQLEFP